MLAAPWEHVAGAVVGASLGSAYLRWEQYEQKALNDMITVLLISIHVVFSPFRQEFEERDSANRRSRASA